MDFSTTMLIKSAQKLVDYRKGYKDKNERLAEAQYSYSEVGKPAKMVKRGTVYLRGREGAGHVARRLDISGWRVKGIIIC